MAEQGQSNSDPFRPKNQRQHRYYYAGFNRSYHQNSEQVNWGSPNERQLQNVQYIRMPNPINQADYSYGPKRPHPQRVTLAKNVKENYLKQLILIWQSKELVDISKKGDAIYSKLVTFFKSDPNPWDTAFDMITSAHDFTHNTNNTLSYTILSQFEKWVYSSDNVHRGTEDSFLTKDFCTNVFVNFYSKNLIYFRRVVKAFMLDHSNNIYLVPECKKLLANNKLVECAKIVYILGLQSHFEQTEILLPLLLLDKISLLESYVMGNKTQQASILGLLDYLCAPNTDLHNFIKSSGLVIPNARKLTKKYLGKLAMKLLELYKFPAESLPNVKEMKSVGAIRFIMHRKFIEKSISNDGWIEMVKFLVDKNSRLQQSLLSELLTYNKVDEAVKWANRFEIPDSLLNPIVVDTREKVRHCKMLGVEPSEVAEDSYEMTADSEHYQFPLPLSSITMVDDKVKLSNCLQRISQPETVIGIDAEWKPCFGIAPEQVSILQLAVSDHVFILDLIELKNKLLEAEWVAIATAIFCDEKIVKLGYGLGTDLNMLVESIPSFNTPLSEMARVIELQKLAEQVFSHSNSSDIQPSESTEKFTIKTFEMTSFKEEKGLSLLVKKTLGTPLSKKEQMSNWENRPLRESQLLYAALDAFVLLEVHKKLLAMANSFEISLFNLETPVVFKKETKANRKNDDFAKTNQSKKLTNDVHASVKARFVCDSMLEGLGRQLRIAGFDTYILDKSELPKDAIQLCLTENRIFLSSGRSFPKISQSLGDDKCYWVRTGVSIIVQCRDVLKYFKLIVDKDDILSRCSSCNCLDFITLPSKEMEMLHIIHTQQKLAFGMPHSSVETFLDIDQETLSTFMNFGIDLTNFTLLKNRVKIQMDLISKDEPFSTIKKFFICSHCGKVDWDGAYYARLCDQFENMLTRTPDEINYNPEERFDYDQDYKSGDNSYDF